MEFTGNDAVDELPDSIVEPLLKAPEPSSVSVLFMILVDSKDVSRIVLNVDVG